MSDKALSKDTYDEIVEAVKHGIVSSKQTESALIRDIQITLNRIEDSQLHLKDEVQDIKKYQEEQNSRVFKLAEKVEAQENWKSWATGIATATALLIGTIIGLVAFIFNTSVNNVKEDITRLETKK